VGHSSNQDGYDAFKLDASRSKWKWIEVKSLGDRSFFLSDSYSMSFSTGKFPECKADHVYVSEDGILLDLKAGYFKESGAAKLHKLDAGIWVTPYLYWEKSSITESEKVSYVEHINSYLREDPFLKKYLPLDPLGNDLFNVVKDGVLLCKLINVAMPGTIDERAINTQRVLNIWEKIENHTLCLNSAKAIGCTVVNSGIHDLVESRPQMVLGLISQIIKDGKAYAFLLNVLAPEHCIPSMLDTNDPTVRIKLVLEHAKKMNCRGCITLKDIVEGSPNLNLAFAAHIFHFRNGLSVDFKTISYAEGVQVFRYERFFRLWVNSLGIATYVNNVFEDVRNGWVLLEVLDILWPGSVNWKQASKPPINMTFREVANCDQVVQILKQLSFQYKVTGNDIVQGNKKCIAFSFGTLMISNMQRLLRKSSFHFRQEEMTCAGVLRWANTMFHDLDWCKCFLDKSLSDGIFFLELLSTVEPRVDWSGVKKGKNYEEKKLNATYIISIARKLGCSIFLCPEDIIEV
ncbi:hypothetical protein GIB67_001113, partial [Kingdonia uniflora]